MNWLLGNWIRLVPWALGGLALLGGWIYVHHQNGEIAGLRQHLAVAAANGAVATSLARGNAAALDIARKQHAADDAAIEAHFKRRAEAAVVTTKMLEKIDDAPPSDDGPVAPVLMRAFDCLRQRAASAAGARGEACAAGATGGVAGLPGKP